MGFLKRTSPEIPLRLGLGAMFLYSGTDLLRHPGNWTWVTDILIPKLPDFIGTFITQTIGVELFLKIHGSTELVLAFILLATFLPRWPLKLASIVIVLEFIGILWFTGIETIDITFRDIGLLGAAIALLLLSYRKR